jgi:hypothetical protein
MTVRQSFAIILAFLLGTVTVGKGLTAQDLIIDHFDGTATIRTLEEAHPEIVIEKNETFEPSLGRSTYLIIAVDMANMRVVDTMEEIFGVADPGYVHELFQMAAGTGTYDGIVASYKYDSYGAFVLESDYMGVYQSTRKMEPGCDADFLENAAEEVWPHVKKDARAQDIDLASYDGLVWWFPYGPCITAGFAYIGPVNGLFDYSYRAAFIVFPGAGLLKHEIGHTRGLMHLNCFFDNGEVDEYCEGGNMGYGGSWVTAEGDPYRPQENDLYKTAANNQYALGWTSPTGETKSAGPPGNSRLRRLVPGAAAPDSTFLNVARSGTYRISAHRGPASENAYPELLIIPSEVQYKNWFISFEEGDGFNPDLDVFIKIGEQVQKVTVRYQFQYPDHLDASIRQALLGGGECVELEDRVEVCNEALYGSEEADVSVKFPGWRTRRTFGRRVAQGP